MLFASDELADVQHRRRRNSLTCAFVAAGLLLVLLALRPGDVAAAGAQATAATSTAMTWWKAMILGIVEGLTEYVPVSSTGHLLVANEFLGLGTSDEDIAAANTYAIAIQFGAILAVAGLFWRRFVQMVQGLFGKSDVGRKLLVLLVVAFAPAAVIGFFFADAIEERLFSPWPIVAAWAVGGLLILGLERGGYIPRRGEFVEEGRDPLLEITVRQAFLIGLIQTLAMWPGTSRSLATILGALLVGVGLAAAVEFSFLLGFITLTAASVYSLQRDGDTLIEQFGYIDPLIGLVFAFISAVIAIKWMIDYLQRHSLAIFGWYRLAAASVTASLILAGVISV